MFDKDYFLARWGSNKQLDKLVNHEDWGVRFSVAENPKANKEHLDKLSEDKNIYIRSSVARNTPHKEHLDKLIKDENLNIRYELSKNANLSKEHLDELSKDENLSVRTLAKEQLQKRFPEK